MALFAGDGDLDHLSALGATSITRLEDKADTGAFEEEARRCDNDCVGMLAVFTPPTPAEMYDGVFAGPLLLLPPRGGGILPAGAPFVISRD